MFSDRDKHRLLSIFRGRCAYCRMPLQAQVQWDHVVPERYGGSDNEHNRVPVCPQCNQNKKNALDARDPVTGRYASEARGGGSPQSLFHPRRDRWSEHFVMMRLAEREPYPVGTTVVGRATATLLFAVPRTTAGSFLPNFDLRWWVTQRLEDDLYLYQYYNRQLSLLSAHRFHLLGPLPSHRPRGPRQALVKDLADLHVQLHVRRARGRPSDMMRALIIAARALSLPGLSEVAISQLRNDVAVVLSDLSTYHLLRGQTDLARRLDALALTHYSAVLQDASIGSRRGDLREFRRRLREAAIVGRMNTPRTISVQRSDIALALRLVEDFGDFELLLTLATLQIEGHLRAALRNDVFGACDGLMQRCGYGQDFDLLLGIAARYRWWALRLLDLGAAGVDQDLLKADLMLWLDRECFSAVRSLIRILRTLGQRTDRRKDARTIRRFVEATIRDHPSRSYVFGPEPSGAPP